ncbi:MAG: KH domain-containing protein [bacterium]|jgi:predicted RNA-binding protein YlqC (UPF0109 family)
MSNIDQEFVEFTVKSLVSNPEAVKIERTIDEKGVLLELTVDPEDLGRVIGKRGATAQSLRTLLRALGTKNDARYNLKIIDNGPGDYKPRSEQPIAEKNSQESDTEPSDDNSSESENTTQSSNHREEDTSDRLRKARAELADLDDLDV